MEPQPPLFNNVRVKHLTSFRTFQLSLSTYTELKLNNLFLFFLFKLESPTIISDFFRLRLPSSIRLTLQRLSLETVGLFSKMFQRLEGMERNLMNRMTTLERKVDIKNIQQLKVQNTNQPSPQPKWDSSPLVTFIRRPEQQTQQQIYKIIRKV